MRARSRANADNCRLLNTGRLGWSLANIALATCPKLDGIPWVVDAHGQNADLIIGVGRSDIHDEDGAYRHSFGYAVAFVASGAYVTTRSFPQAIELAGAAWRSPTSSRSLRFASL